MAGAITRDERRHRIEQDDGDLDDTVYRVRTSGRGDICYHDDPDCADLTADDPADMTRRECHRRLYPACTKCVLDQPHGGRSDQRPSLRHKLDEVDYEFEWDRKHGEEVA
ncbi:hypothetical protein BDK61_2749 [Haloarcula quadrata]|uniref:Uncharacterized protein n=1 Tax=Haloarcula quadrata TaxID=182779 RepID=A0A495R8D9_9EURY|nr:MULTISPECIES: hypothetical protein [Haloarcula]KZX49321.1 hypothetical protein AV929_12320 [Haloarcula sp. K1]RKS83366.1 hypothetical protein BDK61_2749 [Haloarcula quadrata]RLM39290.1 hypothetical protein DVK01_01655 [Haloarcula sp. Atlit-120R]